jgi:predicted transcriptional regulator
MLSPNVDQEVEREEIVSRTKWILTEKGWEELGQNDDLRDYISMARPVVCSLDIWAACACQPVGI